VAVECQPVLTDRLDMLGPGVAQDYVDPVMGEVTAGVAADRPGADDRDAFPHDLLPVSCLSHDKLAARETIPKTCEGEQMNWTERRERFHAILSGNRCVHPGSVYDAISARIAEDLGFEVGMFSRSIGSMSVLGAP